MVISINTHGQPGGDEFRADLRKRVEELNAKKPITNTCPSKLGECEHWHYEVRENGIIAVHEPHE